MGTPAAAASVAAAAAGGGSSGASAGAGAVPSPMAPTITPLEARRQLYDACSEVVDDLKEKAAKSTFAEPTKCYYRAIGDLVMEGDVDVHGMNVYLAVLWAALGVRTSRVPLLHDVCCGIIDVSQLPRAGMEKAMTALWADSNLGRDWEGVPGVARTMLRSVSSGVMYRNQFPFAGSGSPGGIAMAALSAAASSATDRGHIAVLLRQFASYFKPQLVLPRLVSALTAEPALLAHAQVVFERLKAAQPRLRGARPLKEEPDAAHLEAAGDYTVAAETTDIRYWLWDLDDLPPSFHMEAALALFRYLGVVKPAVAEPADGSSGAGSGGTRVAAGAGAGSGSGR